VTQTALVKNQHIRYTKLDSNAISPKRNNSTDAGADLYSLEGIVIPPLGRAMIKTGIALQIPDGWYGRIAPRSGLALSHGIDVLAGVVDSSYRGEVCVVLHNTDAYESFTVQPKQRIAQLIIEKHYNFNFEESLDLEDSERSKNGFGSSGLL
jgi:dUTP pyrophosphatase